MPPALVSRRTRCRAEAGQAAGGFPAGGRYPAGRKPGRYKLLSLPYEEICHLPVVRYLPLRCGHGAGIGRYDRHDGLFPAAGRAARGGAGQPYGRRAVLRRCAGSCGGHCGSVAGGGVRRDDTPGRPAARSGLRRDRHFLPRARVSRYGRRGRACRKFGGCRDRDPDPLALRREYEAPFGRSHAVVRRTGGRHAGRGSAVLYLLYHDAPYDGRLCRIRPQRYRARPSQPQRAPRRRPRAGHEIQIRASGRCRSPCCMA